MRWHRVLTLTVAVVLTSAVTARADHERSRDAAPVPIPGGFQLPGVPLLHVFAPGPAAIGFQGENVDPSTITDFHGFSALAYPGGSVTDAAGKTYDMWNDMLLFQGTYVGSDGKRHHGTFGFV